MERHHGSHYLCVIIIWATIGCASGRINITSRPPADVTVLSWDDLAETEALGRTPLSVPKEKLKFKLVRLKSDGKLPLNIVLVEPGHGDLDIDLHLNDPRNTLAEPTPPALAPLAASAKPPAPAITPVIPPKCDSPADIKKQVSGKINQLSRALIDIVEAYKSEDFARMRRVADTVVKQNPKVAAPHVFLGLAHLHEGNTDAARRSFVTALQIDPGNQNVEALINYLK